MGRSVRRTELPIEAVQDGKLPTKPTRTSHLGRQRREASRRKEGARWERADVGSRWARSGQGQGNLPHTQDTESEHSDRYHPTGDWDSSDAWPSVSKPGAQPAGRDVRTLEWEPSHQTPKCARARVDDPRSILWLSGLRDRLERKWLGFEPPPSHLRRCAHCALSHSHHSRLGASPIAKQRTENLRILSPPWEVPYSVHAQWRGAQCVHSFGDWSVGTFPRPLGRWEALQSRPPQCERAFAGKIPSGDSQRAKVPRTGSFPVATFPDADARNAQCRESGTSQ